MIEVRLKKSAEKELMRLQKKIAGRILDKLRELEKEHPHKQAKKLAGHDSYYRVRVGLYRVVYEYECGIIEVTRIRHRSKVYDGLI